LISQGFSLLEGIKQAWSVENKPFQAKCVNISKMVGDLRTKLLLMTNRKLRVLSTATKIDNLV